MLLPNFYLFWPCFFNIFVPLESPVFVQIPASSSRSCCRWSRSIWARRPLSCDHRFKGKEIQETSGENTSFFIVFLFFPIKYRGFMGFHGVSCFQISFSLKMVFCNFSTRNFGDRTNVESSARVIGLSSRKMAEIEFQGCAVGVLFSQDISLIIWPAN